MDKYKIRPREVDAVQYFPGKKLPIDGFSSVFIQYTDPATMQTEQLIKHGQIKTGDNVIIVKMGQWVLIDANNRLTIREHEDFINDYEKMER